MPPSPSLPPPSFAIEPEAILFADDGFVPNNPRLPFVIYRGAIDLIGVVDPEEAIEKVFRRNGWGDMWRNGIYPYIHYHSMISTKAWASPACTLRRQQGPGDRAHPGRRRGAAGRHRASVPVA
jgi:hypothetical protein